jgi:hypothetical protein
LLPAPAMQTRLFASLVPILFALGCSSSSPAPDAPVIDSLEVPAQTSTLTLNGQTAPGVILTLTAHDDSSGLDALHVVFKETGQDQPISIPGSPTKVQALKIEFIVPNAPSGPHEVSFHLTNAHGASSATVTNTITVP